MNYPKLTFGKANAKLVKLEQKTGLRIATFSMMSGYTCPGAKDCLSKAVIGFDGRWRIEDGPETQFRCFSASQEVLFPSVRESRIANMAILELAARDWVAASHCIVRQIPKNTGIVRIHVAADFATQAYFDTWLAVAAACPSVRFYAYTKMLPLWVKRLHNIPHNLSLTASVGGKFDDLIGRYNLKYARVVYSENEAQELGLPIDHDDSLALDSKESFALLIHGVMPKGSEAAKAVSALNGVGSYTRGVNNV